MKNFKMGRPIAMGSRHSELSAGIMAPNVGPDRFAYRFPEGRPHYSYRRPSCEGWVRPRFLEAFLTDAGLEQFTETFISEEINMDCLREITIDDLISIGMDADSRSLFISARRNLPRRLRARRRSRQ
uniref:SAM domain-containing protein n=1 Tax=Spongospora subterranea TaxID=70186 RepID=A0A0H5R238_9EUKA|eukprot:CRZ01904.1 hypothetical protein [Spongospora subterranea]